MKILICIAIILLVTGALWLADRFFANTFTEAETLATADKEADYWLGI